MNDMASDLIQTTAPDKRVRTARQDNHRAGAQVSLARIMVVDDDAGIRETLADLLEADDYTPIKAANASQALTILRQNPAGIDLLVTDLSMPGPDGIALIIQARALRPDLPAILLTGYAEQTASVAVSAAGGYHVLRKPIDSKTLTQQIKCLLSCGPT